MSEKSHQIFASDIRATQLEGMKALFMKWLATQEGRDAQEQWRAITSGFINDVLLVRFFADSGHPADIAHEWARGRRLPSGQMCTHYMALLVIKVDEELNMIADLHQTERGKKGSGDAVTPTNARSIWGHHIQRFALPETIMPDAQVEDLPGYLDLRVRLRNGVTNTDIVTAGQLVEGTRGRTWSRTFKAVENFGRTSYVQLYKYLTELGCTPILEE